MEPVIVVGAGAAGLMAAIRASELGASVLLLEKTPRVGTKILMSGGGKCNVAHDGPLEDVIRAFRPNEARFLRPACYRLPNRAIIEFFRSRGLEVMTRPDGRVFPVHQTAKDVVAILCQELRRHGVALRMNVPVVGVVRDEEGICGVQTAEGMIPSQQVVLAVGGSSYPKSGTTGDGWAWAKALGHTIVPVRAALAPLRLADRKWGEYAGVALRDCMLKARQAGKEIVRWRGDLLFTHSGLSGPCALECSRSIAEAQTNGGVQAEADLAPDASYEALASELLGAGERNPQRRVLGFLEDYLPERMRAEALIQAAVPLEQAFRDLDRKSRNRLVEAMKGFKLGDVAEVILEKGEVVAGGVALDEVDPHTMASRKCQGLYCCGEALDVAGPVGGYNLQAAFATGWVAGEAAARAWQESDGAAPK